MEIHCCFPEAIGFHGGFSLSEYHPSPIFMRAHTHTYAYIYIYIYMCIIHISVCVHMRVHTVCVCMGRYDTIYVQDLCMYGNAKYQCLYSNTDIYIYCIYISICDARKMKAKASESVAAMGTMPGMTVSGVPHSSPFAISGT